jgi:hypothetical protein
MLRKTVLVLTGLEALLALAFIALMLQATDPIGSSIGRGMAMLTAIPLAALVLPALALAIADRWLKFALALSLLALPLSALLWVVA